ncbi:hypothetical protein AGABI2DRAFT_189782 [Agaricus bisporus var. bisporus H97]|uniref:hypothetical protein n=1 Tax=Agaricus bisporus var. bisporus (strain H97 / ATCC MYA-4626 / FGSC 10389) TaxID=936046 RepID=UPI00029F68A3|nr:hypothetical protein AGABI2DRAFT_189782 [Agaricus bisporus var. bisporus H97]EKV51545.1 hypothetical protein AGABI2DRAFT_189782 [Agaricus bisporus var. bisporus H97]
MADAFAALPGIYRLVFLYIEPLTTFIPFLFVWITPGAKWFFREQVPYDIPASTPLDDRTYMVVTQLVNCYMLLGLLSSFVFRAVRDTLPNNPAAQERILGASFLALAIADATHVLATFIGLPENLRFSPQHWNVMTHGNITTTTLYLVTRVAWFMGIGRTRFYFGQKKSQRAKLT